MTPVAPAVSSKMTPNPSELEQFEFPCSLAQQRFWVLDQLTPGEPCYNIAVRWKLLGRLDAGLAERAFQLMVERHEVLRTTFRSADGEPVQVVAPNVSITVPVVDVRQFPEAQREKEAERVTLEVAKKKFDLTTSPLVRATLLRFHEEEHIILVTVHHIVADGWSIGIMAQEFGDFYQALAEQREPNLPELSIQYADFAIWQQEWLQSEALAAQTVYWKQKLTGLKPLEIEPDFPRPAIQTSNGTITSVLLPRELTDAVKEFSNQQGVTLYTTALAAFKMLLRHCSGQSDIAVGTQVAGRNQVELENLVGVFINTLLLRSEVTGDLKFIDLLRRVDDTVTEAIANQETPFERLVELLRPKRDLSRNPLFGINFIYQRAFIKNRDFAGISLIDIPSRSPGAIYDLNFFMVERIEGWRWSCEYNTDLYSAQTVQRMLASFQDFLRAIVENPERKVSEFQLSEAQGQVANQVAVNRKQARASVEAELTKIWETLLVTSPISKNDDFFELGGHSLLATRLLSRIEKSFDKKITLATLFQSSTIQQLATVLLGGETGGPVPGVVALQAKGSRTPVICLHGVPSMRNLATQLGPDQPFVSVNIPDELTFEAPFTMDRLAALHVEAIRKFQPAGPYILLGWCREALLGLEVAKQLRTQGEEVGLVGMFDTWIPHYISRFSKSEARYATWLFDMERLRVHARHMKEVGLFRGITYIAQQVGGVVDDRLRHFRWRAAYRKQMKSGIKAERRRSQDEILLLAVNEYQPEKYDGQVVLFRSDRYRGWKYWDARLGWGDLLPNMRVQEVPGGHEEMLTGPYLPAVAQTIADSIDTAAGPGKTKPSQVAVLAR
jgi:thioesterase domain-containing protein/acyl carrier protein